MTKPTITAKQHFNRPLMVKTMDRAKAEVHREAGEMVVRTARSLIQQSETISQPGSPPNGKTGLLQASILFEVEGGNNPTVLVGPKRLDRSNDAVRTSSPVPSILEHGGKIEVHEVRRPDGTWRRIGFSKPPLILSAAAETRWRRVTVKKRPFMLPALKASQKHFPGLWRGKFKKG